MQTKLFKIPLILITLVLFGLLLPNFPLNLVADQVQAEQETSPGGAALELEIESAVKLSQNKLASVIQNSKVVMFEASHNQDPYNDCSYWIEDLEAAGYTVLVNTEPLSSQATDIADVLIVMVLRHNYSISSPYTASEAQIIKQYVSKGGGLMVLADHSGYSWYAQEISSAFGIILNGETILKQPIFSSANFDAGHPIMAGINSIGYNWYTTIIPGTASPLIWEDDGDAVAVTFSEGSGRGAVFGDSNWPLSIFNNYYWVDNSLLALQTVDWLAGQIGWEAPPPEEDEEWLFNVAVILAETNDVPHQSSSITAQPCKLLPEKTYPQGRNKEYFEDLLYCVTDYHKENSFGKVNLNFEIYDNDGEWFKTDKEESYYAKNEIELVKDAEALSGVDPGLPEGEKIVIVVHSGESSKWKFWKISSQTWSKSNEVVISENDLVKTWAHEIGHVLGVKLTPENTSTPDLYKMGNVDDWDIMAGKLWTDETNPPYMSSYIKEFLGWLNYDIHSKSAYGEYWINSLETSEFGDKVFRYNLSDDTNDESPKYYILEARNRNLKTWDSSLPEEKALVLYKVDTKGYPEYGYDSKMVMNNQYRKINIPFFDGILTPDGDSHLDMINLIYFTAISDEQTSDKYRINSKIEKVGYDFFEDRFQGIILEPSSQLYDKVIHLFTLNTLNLSSRFTAKMEPGRSYPIVEDIEARFIVNSIKFLLFFFILFDILLIFINKKVVSKRGSEKVKKIINILIKILLIITIIIFVIFLSIIFLYDYFLYSEIPPKQESISNLSYDSKNDNLINSRKVVLASSIEPTTLPDLDLHLYCDDDRHIGMNYETGEYEVQIPEAIVSGNNQGAPEWIFIPESITDCRYVVSSYNNQRFLEENPEIAQEIEDTTDSYEVYARYIDNETAIYTSAVISENIAPGIELKHLISGTDDIEIGQGILIADVSCDPDTLNLNSEGQWITCYIELPDGYDVWEIDSSTILLNGVVPVYLGKEGWAKAESNESNIIDDDGELKIMVKFERNKVQEILEPGEAILTITGKVGLADFEGEDTIRVDSP